MDRWQSDEERCVCRLDLTPLNTGPDSMGSKVTNRKVWEDVLSVMRIRTFQIIVLQVRSELRNPNSHLSWHHTQRPGITT